MKPWLSKLWPSLLKLTRTDETWTYCSEKHFLKLDDDDFFSQTTFLHFFVRFEFPGKSRYRLAGRREAAATLTLRRVVGADADQEMIFRVRFLFFPSSSGNHVLPIFGCTNAGFLVGICGDEKVFVGLINIKQMWVNKLCHLCLTVCDLNYILLKNLEQNWELQFWIKISLAHA